MISMLKKKKTILTSWNTWLVDKYNRTKVRTQRSVGVRQHWTNHSLVLSLLSVIGDNIPMKKYLKLLAFLVLLISVPTTIANSIEDENEPLRSMPPYAEEQRLCLAKNIYFESGNQSLAGRVAVANVTMNRVIHHKFPNTICDVVYQGPTFKNWRGEHYPIRGRCQFSWYCDGKSDEPKDSKTWMESLRIADAVLYMEYQDISDGALWYHADYVSPNWSNHLRKVMVIDNHIFYR